MSVDYEYKLVFKKGDQEFVIATAQHPDTASDLARLRDRLIGCLAEWDAKYVTLADDVAFVMKVSGTVPNGDLRAPKEQG